MGKGEGSISIIGGADGPTSIFIAGKGGKVKLTTRIQNYFRKLKRNRVKKRITANPQSPYAGGSRGTDEKGIRC